MSQITTTSVTNSGTQTTLYPSSSPPFTSQLPQPYPQRLILNNSKITGGVEGGGGGNGNSGGGDGMTRITSTGYAVNSNYKNIHDKLTIASNNSISSNNKGDVDIVTEMNKMYKKSPFTQRKINELEYGSPKKESTLASIGELSIIIFLFFFFFCYVNSWSTAIFSALSLLCSIIKLLSWLSLSVCR